MANDNLAHQMLEEQLPLQQPEQSPKRIVKPGQHQKPSRFSKAEKFFAVLIAIVVTVMMMRLVAVQNSISSVSKTLQDYDAKVTDVNHQNANFEQEKAELSRYERVMDIADQYGLKINENNIRNVSK